jgi:hypothetical protein
MRSRHQPGADAVLVRMYDVPPTQREYVNMQYSLLESLREFDPDIVVYMYKIENKLHDIATVSRSPGPTETSMRTAMLIWCQIIEYIHKISMFYLGSLLSCSQGW